MLAFSCRDFRAQRIIIIYITGRRKFHSVEAEAWRVLQKANSITFHTTLKEKRISLMFIIEKSKPNKQTNKQNKTKQKQQLRKLRPVRKFQSN